MTREEYGVGGSKNKNKNEVVSLTGEEKGVGVVKKTKNNVSLTREEDGVGVVRARVLFAFSARHQCVHVSSMCLPFLSHVHLCIYDFI